MEEYVHCPNCPDQGWYAEMHLRPRYGSDENGADTFLGYEEEWEQIQCEFCWTVPNSYFNKDRELENETI